MQTSWKMNKFFNQFIKKIMDQERGEYIKKPLNLKVVHEDGEKDREVEQENEVKGEGKGKRLKGEDGTR